MVTWEQRATAGDPKFAASQDLPDFRHADFAQSLGLDGVRVERPDDIGAAWDRAFAADRPCVLEAVTDPDVPPLQPHITFEQARSFASAAIKENVKALGYLTQTVKEVAASVLPHRKE